MITSFWLFHCGYFLAPERLLSAHAPSNALVKSPFLAGLAIHKTLGPILIDAPFGHDGLKSAGRITDALLKKGGVEFKPQWAVVPRIKEITKDKADSVKHVLMTHLHFDHTGGMKDLSHATFHISRHEWDGISSMSTFQTLRFAIIHKDFMGIKDRIKTFDWNTEKADLTVKGTDIFGDGSIEAIALPGHSMGHTGYRFHMTDGRTVLYVGDALYTISDLDEPEPKLSRMEKLSGHDQKAVQHTRNALCAYRQSHPETVIICSHDIALGEQCMGGPVQLA